MKSDAEIRMTGMRALIAALGLVEAERFVAVMARDSFDYTAWRQHGLPDLPLETLAAEANRFSAGIDREFPVRAA
ncbi:MAG: hypothetical protein ACKN9W_14965 [Methylococcus sp.]